jgi:hypothetical protein
MGLVEIVQGEPLDVLEDGEPQVAHRALPDPDGALDLRDRQKPSEQQVAEVDEAHQQNPSIGNRRAGKVCQVTVDADLDELRTEQLRAGGQQGEGEVEDEGAAIGADVAGQAQERSPAHSLLGERFFELDVDLLGHHAPLARALWRRRVLTQENEAESACQWRPDLTLYSPQQDEVPALQRNSRPSDRTTRRSCNQSRAAGPAAGENRGKGEREKRPLGFGHSLSARQE